MTVHLHDHPINTWMNKLNFPTQKCCSSQYSGNFRVSEKVEIYHNSWSVCVLWETCWWNLQMTNPSFHAIPAYSEYVSEWKLHCCSEGPELIIQTCYREILKHYFTGNERMGVSRCLCCLGCDAAGALASLRPPDETGGRHSSGLCERDHDPHALPPERDHHFHIQTGIAASPQAAFHHFHPRNDCPIILFWFGKSGIPMRLIVYRSSQTNHCVWKQDSSHILL